MKLSFVLFGIDFKLNVLTLIVFIVSILTDNYELLLLNILTLSMHEFTHVIVAKTLKYEIRHIEIYPFGCVAKMDSNVVLPRDELIIALAGPVFSIICALCSFAVFSFLYYEGKMSGMFLEHLQMFSKLNMLLGVINLIPAFPLDGGRILNYLLKRNLNMQSSVKIKRLAIFFALILLISIPTYEIVSYGLTDLGVTASIMAFFLLYNYLKNKRGKLPNAALNILQRNRLLKNESCLEIKFYEVYKDTTLNNVSNYFKNNIHLRFIVLDSSNNEIGVVNEEEVIFGLVAYGRDTPIGKLLQK